MINTNLLHNVLNILLVFQAMLIAGLISTGCIQMADGSLDCHASWISPVIIGYLIGGTAALKIIINIARDGIWGLFKWQPPVT